MAVLSAASGFLLIQIGPPIRAQSRAPHSAGADRIGHLRSRRNRRSIAAVSRQLRTRFSTRKL